MHSLSLALDWTPNINHIGFFVAQELDIYHKHGIDLEISDPRADDYETTPAKKLEFGLVDLALCPTESLISYRTKSTPFDIIGLAAIFQEDLSAVAVLKKSDIKTPKDLDGKTYSSYHARYEDGIVREMIKNAGGKGEMNTTVPAKLGIWESLLQQKADATWIFMNWEGVIADDKEIDLRCFKLADYGIPYSYSPVIAANAKGLRSNRELYTSFLKATKAGFMHCLNKPEQAVDILSAFVPQSDYEIDLRKSLKISRPYFGQEKNWGKIDRKVVGDFLNWIRANNLESAHLSAKDLFWDDSFKR